MENTFPDRFRTFEDLEVYKVARQFRIAMYAVTRRLPRFEGFALADQIRRAAVSLTNNIAEGHGRYHYLDELRFLAQARGSLQELIDDLNVCLDESYLSQSDVESLKQDGWAVRRLINGYARYLRAQKKGESATMHDSETSYVAENEQDDPFAGLSLTPE